MFRFITSLDRNRVPLRGPMPPGGPFRMFRRTLTALFALAGAAAVSACAPQTVYVPQPVPMAPAPVACDTRFQVVNNSSMTVMQLFFSHASIANWGVDQ